MRKKKKEGKDWKKSPWEYFKNSVTMGKVKWNNKRRKKEECKNKMIVSPGYNSFKYKTPSSTSLQRLLAMSPSQSFVWSTSH
jgi:hypothetical protein